MHVTDLRAVFEHVEQNRGRDVVGQVADQADAVFAGQLAEIDLQHVFMHDGQFADAMRGFAQRRNQVAVEFDDGQATVFFQQREGDGALARADFHQHIALFRVDRMHDMLDDAAVG